MSGGEKIERYMAVVIAALTVLTALSVIFTAIPQAQGAGLKAEQSTMNVPEIASEYEKYFKEGPKITPTLQNVLKNTPENERIWVHVLTNDLKSLGNALRAMSIKTQIGTAPNSDKVPLRDVVLYLTPTQVQRLAQEPSVLKIYNHAKAEIQVEPSFRKELIDGRIGNVLNPLNFKNKGIYQTLHHNVAPAWDEGIMGSNVTIAILDTGVDFAQPNLYGAWAVEENTSSPYYGWPIVFDAWSVALYVDYNITGIDAYYVYNTPSFFVDTSYNTTALPNGTVYFNGHYYDVSGIHSASGHYHLGLLPETYNYLAMYGEVPAVLVVDSSTNYSYDTVYVDLDLDYSFTDEKPTNKSSPVSYKDNYDANSETYNNDTWNGGDGYPDLSGGLIYFIADGEHPMPGTTFYAWWYGMNVSNLPIPGKGNLVAFEGDFDDYPHGTACAANVASRGVTIGGLGIGMAPRAKIIAQPHFWFLGEIGWMFAHTGYIYKDYDAASGDISSDAFSNGDEAQISSNSWGSSFVHWDGWDTVEDRYYDYVAYVYPQFYGKQPITSYLVALGNGGPGYGTATSPAVQHAISVGAGSEWGYRQVLGYGDSTLYDSYYGDVVDFSGRGPFANGKATPDILATGEFGITPMALNYPDFFGYVGDGSMHFDLFSGTSMATPVAAGGLALIYDAYYKVHGTYPDMDTAKMLLLSAADDHNYDPLSQGPGWLNVGRAVDMILGKGGIGISPNIWNVGKFDGNEYPMFAGIVHPGETISKDFSLTNFDSNSSHTTTVQLSTAIYRKTYEYNISFDVLYNEGSVVNRWFNLSNLSQPIPNNIDLLQIMLYTNYSNLDSPSDEMHTSPNIYYMVGFLWDYINYTTVNNYTDRMRMQVSSCQGNSMDVMFHDPMRRLHGDMWYQLLLKRLNAMNMTFHMKIVGYSAVNWNWLTLSATSINIHGGSTGGFTATINVPSNAKPGIYEGKILVQYGSNVSSIPVVVYVAAQINTISDVITMGGEDLSDYNTYLYDNSHVRGLYDWAWRAEAGDWRFFFLNVSNSIDVTNAFLTVDISWESNMTDIDGFILGNYTDVLSYYFPSLYGPYTLAVTGASKNMYVGGGMYARYTTSGGPREVISAPLQNGLMEILLHNVLYSGINASEKFSVKVYITTIPQTSYNIDVGDLAGLNGTHTVDFTTYTSSNGLDVKLTPMIYLKELNNIPIETGQQKLYMLQTTGWKYLAFRAVSIDPNNDDIDLYVYYYDSNADLWRLFGYSATASGDEYVEVGDPSEYSDYWIALIDGYDVEPGCTFDLTIYEGLPNLPQVTVSNVPNTINPGVPTSFDFEYDFSGYNIPAGTYITTIYFGSKGSGGSYPVHITFNALDQRAPSVDPMTTGVVGTSQPTLVVRWNDTGISSPPKNATWWIDGVKIPEYRTGISSDGEYLYATPQFLLAEGIHQVKVYYEDSAGNGNTTVWTFEVDTTAPALSITSPVGGVKNLTYSETLWINGTTDPGANVTINGVSVSVDSNGNFSYKATLEEGLNIFVVEAKDEVGNTATATVRALYLPQLPQLWQAINEIYTEIGNLRSQISDLQNQVNTLNGQVSDLQNQLSDLQGQLNQLRSELDSLQNALNENVTALNQAIQDMRSDLVDMINENISAINSRINDISGQVDEIKGEIDNIKAKNNEQDGAIGTNNILGIIGIVLAIVAILIALVAMKKGGGSSGSSSETEEIVEEPESEEEESLEEI